MKIPRSAIVALLAAHGAVPTWASSSPWGGGGPNPSASYSNPGQYQQQWHDPSAASIAAPVSERQPPLPPGWAEYFDPSSGMPYYFNEKDGTTTWERPVAEQEVNPPPASIEDTGVDNNENALDGQESSGPVDGGQSSPISSTPEPETPKEQALEPPLATRDPYANTTATEEPMQQKLGMDANDAPGQISESPGWGMGNPQATPPAFVGGPKLNEARDDRQTAPPETLNTGESRSPQNNWQPVEKSPQMPSSFEHVPLQEPSRMDSREGRAPEQMPAWGQRPPEAQGAPPGTRTMSGDVPLPQGGPPHQPPTQQQPQHQPLEPRRSDPPLQQGTMPAPGLRQPMGPAGMPPRQAQQPQQPQQQQQQQQQQQGPPSQTMPPPQRQMPPQGYQPNQPPYQQQQPNTYGQYGQQRGPPPQGQYYSQYSQYGQYQGYGRYPPQPRNQLIPAETTTAVQGALSNAWHGIVGFGNRTKEAVETARSSVVETAKEASQTITSTSTSWWGQAKNAFGSFFEPSPDDGATDYSLSGSSANPQGSTPGRGPHGYPPQGPQGYPGYPPQGGQRGYPPQGQQPGYPSPGGYPPQGQSLGYPPRVPGYPPQGPDGHAPQGIPRQPGQPPQRPQQPGGGPRYPPGYGQQQPPPGSRWDPPHPNGPNGQRPPQYPPVQSQWGQPQSQQQFGPPGGRPYPERPGQGPPGQQNMAPDPNKPDDKKEGPNPWAHPGLSGDF